MAPGIVCKILYYITVDNFQNSDLFCQYFLENLKQNSAGTDADSMLNLFIL